MLHFTLGLSFVFFHLHLNRAANFNLKVREMLYFIKKKALFSKSSVSNLVAQNVSQCPVGTTIRIAAKCAETMLSFHKGVQFVFTENYCLKRSFICTLETMKVLVAISITSCTT